MRVPQGRVIDGSYNGSSSQDNLLLFREKVSPVDMTKDILRPWIQNRVITRFDFLDGLLDTWRDEPGPAAAFILCILHAFADKNLLCGNSGRDASLLNSSFVKCLVQG